MKMESIHYYLYLAAVENRDGAWSLANGNVAQALEIFQNAIHILDQLRSLPEITTSDVLRTHFCVPVEVPFLGCSDNRYYVYNGALIFSPVLSETCLCQDLAYYSGVVFFNMAIALSMKGKVLQDEKSNQKAIYFYNACLEALACVPSGNPDVDLTRVAALNNKALLYCGVLEFGQAKSAFDEVRGKWRHALVLHATTMAFVRGDVEGFILNTMEVMPPTAAACA